MNHSDACEKALRKQTVTARPHEELPMIIVTKRETDHKGKAVKLCTMNLSFEDAMRIGKAAEHEKLRREELRLR